MKCLRSGWCCIWLDVIIICPESATEDFVVDEGKDEDFMHKESGKMCPHLQFNDNEAFCSVHNMPWYEDTPCYKYTQIERSEKSPCRMGEHLKKRGRDSRESLLKEIE